MKALVGTGVALVTPFKKDGSVDHKALETIVNFNIDNGINYLVIMGTTAESATLSKSEKEAVMSTIKATNNMRLPLVLGIGGNNTAQVVTEIKQMDLSDFTAILSVSPFYNKPTQEGVYQHFKTIAEASPKPIILYNVPGRTASNMAPETVMRLARDFDNIIAIKEAAGDMVQAMYLIKNKPEDFLIISGDDMLTLPMILAGGSGVISVIGQGLPKEFSKMVQLALEGNHIEAYGIQYELMDAIDMIFEEGNPAGIKAVLEIKELSEAAIRLPLIEASDNLKSKLKRFMA
ncbi:MAG: 4-hydroxy-tetrahydrodipicolinate synthase [Flavobacteriaceae bacterium]|nr:4-hydroxy-tetrahydrodipicolinate synthase [Flavobacteriaceae bacterium]